jgi:hypothetical protein
MFGHFARMVTAANKGTAGDHAETELPCEFANFIKFFGRKIAFDWEMFRGRLEVLSEGQHGTADVAEVGENFEEFIEGFAESQHETAFGGNVGGFVANLSQEIECTLVVSVAAYAVVEPGNGFRVVVEYVWLSLDDTSNGSAVAAEVRGEHFDLGAGAFANGEDCAVPVFGTAVGEVVTGDRGNDDVTQPKSLRRLGHSLRLISFQVFSFALGDGTKAAGPSTNVAADHERGRFGRPAF